MKKNNLKHLIISSIILAIIFLVEIFVCNYKCFTIIEGNQLNYSYESLEVSGLAYDEDSGFYRAIKDNPTIEIKNINESVTTIYFNGENKTDNAYNLEITVDYKDETRTNYYVSYGKKLTIINDYERSKYIKEDYNGSVSELKLVLNIDKGDLISFDGLSINKKIPFDFSLARVLLMTFFSFSIYGFIFLLKNRKTLTMNCKHAKLVESLFIFAAIGLTIYVMFLYPTFYNALLSDTGGQLSQELVDAFLNKQVYLLEEPSKELLELADPYNPQARSGIDYLWDHVYYNGKYYSYYGITPVFLLFIPIKLITGKYLYEGYAVILFSLIAIIFASFAYFKLVRNYFENCPLCISLPGYVLFFMSAGYFFNIFRPYFYEVATSCSNMCMMIALYHLVSSKLLSKENEKIKNYHLLFTSFWIALAVLSRATNALYAICHVVILAIYYIKHRKEFNTKNKISYILLSLVPYAIFGSVQCIYNYLRFGSFLEFGIQYSLTINDFTKTKFHLSLAINSIWNFMFAFPKIDDCNYFFHGNSLTFGASGYYFFETYHCIGLFNRMPLLYGLFVIPFINHKNISFKDKLIHIIKYVIPCVVVPFILVAITWESGFALRYNTDFAWPICIYAIFMFMHYFIRKDKENDTSLINVLSIILCVGYIITFALNMATVHCYIPNLTKHCGGKHIENTYYYYKIARQLSFWL